MIGLERMERQHDFLVIEKSASGRGSCTDAKRSTYQRLY
jgi:hypothetical protein